ncbi:uncharacterized protein LDX57_007896 [Aspergillus melleus]|uniref:uncharacterized protein n=1 Tax=Aspergillus melleus TaxID=138277 RepID=UPI001E8E9E88|nr:uncharacterized protein LDX57_007896 [Aspergillus melleus]KAH8430227.1 hypothetical protein LDX57_007896 [Aspergillus melleus]
MNCCMSDTDHVGSQLAQGFLRACCGVPGQAAAIILFQRPECGYHLLAKSNTQRSSRRWTAARTRCCAWNGSAAARGCVDSLEGIKTVATSSIAQFP